MKIEKLIADAQLNLGPLSGTGLGAILLTVIVLVAIYYFGPTPGVVIELVKSIFSAAK